MRVCHLGKFYPPAPGGIETHVRTLAQAQAALGIDVQVICFNHQPGPGVDERDGPVKVHRVRRLASLAKLEICPSLVKAIRQIDADILHLQVPNPTMILALLAARPKQPIVVTYQSDHVKQRIRGALFRAVELQFYPRVARILATSPTYPAGSSLLQRFSDRLEVLPMGIDLQPYLEPSSDDLARADQIRSQCEGPRWLCCGRLIYYKGINVAIEALQETPGTLLIVGNGPDESRLMQLARQLHVDQRVHFLGAMPYQAVIPYYLAATAFWFPSIARSEAFGLVQVEAMATGCPVINTSISDSGVAWVSPDNETGLTVPVGDAGALAAAARKLVEEPELTTRLSNAARERARGEFDHMRMAERTQDLYQRVVRMSQVGVA